MKKKNDLAKTKCAERKKSASKITEDVHSKSKTKKKICGLKSYKKSRNERNYNTVDIKNALDAMSEGQTLREAANNFGIPKSTLYAKLKHLFSIDCKKGPPSVLTVDEENDIVKWILFCAESGYPIKKSVLLDNIQKLVNSEINNGTCRRFPFKNNRPGKHWYRAFMHRHPNLSKRIAQNLTSTRAAVTEDQLKSWFSKIKTYLEKKNLLSVTSDRIFNLDESSFMLVPKDNSVITEKGARSPYQIVSSNEKACLTVLFTIAAFGQMPPPMILFDLKTTPKKSTLDKIPKGWGIGNTEHGWMTAESFFSYISNVFFNWLKKNNYEFPIILYVDGHVSHMALPLLQFCQQNEIELIVLYPNATHIIQPLDVAVFHPLKDAYRKTLRLWRIDNNVIDFKKSDFATVLNLALQSIDLKNTIKNGFKSCGLYPFDPESVNYNILNKKKRKVSTVESCDTNELNNAKDLELLNVFETKIVSPNVLEDFKRNEFNHSWNGELHYQELFESWRKLKKFCYGENLQNSNVSKAVNCTVELEKDVFITLDQEISLMNSNFHNQEIQSINKNIQDSENYTDIETPMSQNIDHTSVQIIEYQGEISFSELQLLNGANEHIVDSAIVSNSKNLEENADLSAIKKSIISEDLLIIDNNIELSTNENAQQKTLASTIEFHTDNSLHTGGTNNINDSCVFTIEDGSVISKISENEHINNEVDLTSNSNDTIDQEIVANNIVESSSQIQIMFESKIPSNILELDQLNRHIERADVKVIDSNGILNNCKVDLNISPNLKTAFPVPRFSVKNKNIRRSERCTIVSVVDDLIEVLQKKENDKLSKQQKILMNKKEREKAKTLKEKEQQVKKELQITKKKLQDEKKNIKLQLQLLKRQINGNHEKENKAQLEEEHHKLDSRYKEIDRLLIDYEIQALQTKMKIKQENVILN